MGGDPCPFVPKFCHITYTAVSNGGVSTETALTFAENDSVQLSSIGSILSAQYGADGMFADVTLLVDSMVQSSIATTLGLTVDNSTMGGDPCPGIPKSLHITYTVPTTLTNLSFGENATVNLSSVGSIISALYGAHDIYADVTALINSLIHVSNRTLCFTVNNRSMGGDPYPFVAKTLNIQYSAPIGGSSSSNGSGGGSVMQLRCPAGHELVRNDAYRSCDDCGITMDGPFWQCHSCGYDMCIACADTKRGGGFDSSGGGGGSAVGLTATRWCTLGGATDGLRLVQSNGGGTRPCSVGERL